MVMALFLAWHLGLGDAIICNGLVRELASRHKEVVLPVKIPNVPSVRFMFSDLKNVKLIPIRKEIEVLPSAKGYDFMGLGTWSDRKSVPRIGWDRQFYEDAGVPFELRWDGFSAPAPTFLVPPNGRYAFVHHQPEQGRKIVHLPDLPIIEPSRPPHIFYHIGIIAGAEEIHVVNSCFLNLIESIYPISAKRLVLHNYARTDSTPPTLHKSWEILN